MIRRLRPRTVRGRLVASYTLAAIILALLGSVLFARELHRGLLTSLDAALETRSDPLIISLAGPAGGPLPTDTVVQSDSSDPGISVTVAYSPQATATDVPGLPLSDAQLASVRAGAVVRADWNYSGDTLRLHAQSFSRPDGVYVLLVGADLSTVSDASDHVDRTLALAGPLLLLLVVLSAWTLSGAALRPVEQLRAEAAALGEHDPAGRLSDPGTGDELATLGATFNDLLDRLHRSLRRQQALVADAGHELRTPLAVLKMELELADRPNRDRDELAEAVGHARTEVDRLARLAEDLLFLARVDGSDPLLARQPCDLAVTVAEAERAWRARAAEAGLDIVVLTPPRVDAVADASSLRRVVDNLVANSVKLTPRGGTVTISLTVADGDDGRRWASLVVADTGPGFPAAFLPRAFERFSRSDASRTGATGGAGLGLAIVAEIAHAHGGSAAAGVDPGGGARVEVRVPLAPPGMALPTRALDLPAFGTAPTARTLRT